MNILEKIVTHKKIEIAEAKARISVAELEKSPLFGRETNSLVSHLATQHAKIGIGVIAEFKRQSPSKGIINDRVLPEIVTRGYAAAGAAGLSVLTDTPFFGGTFDDFAKARFMNPTTPLLRKDFMVDEYQLWEAKAMGADVILLIAACLSPVQVATLAQQAHELGMEVLLEVHDRDELERSVCADVDMVGVNNRNLKTFQTSIETSLELADLIPPEFVKISESSLKDAETIMRLQSVGYQGFLIGETFMKSENPVESLQNLIQSIQSLTIHQH
jgi:indole-3-glycerol phosphate synthase